MSLHDLNPGAVGQQVPPLPASGRDKNGLPLDDSGQTAEDEDLHYVPVPSRTTVTVSVRYTVRGRGRPLPYPLDEGDGG